MTINHKKNSIHILVLTILLLPTVAYGAIGIPCGGTVPPANHPCGFNDLITLGNNIVHFLMYTIAVPLAALGFMWAGADLVLNQDKEGAWSQAKGRFGDIAIGFVIMIVSYVVIKTILYAFLNTDQGYTLFLLQ